MISECPLEFPLRITARVMRLQFPVSFRFRIGVLAKSFSLVCALSQITAIFVGCTAQSHLQQVESSNSPQIIQGGVVIEPAPVVGQVLPVKVTVPDFGGQLWAEDCYATTEDGRRVAPMDPEATVIAAGAEPLAKAIVDEADSTASQRATSNQVLTGMKIAWAVLGFASSGISPDIDVPANAVIENWSLPMRMKEGIHIVCPNRCYVYFPSGKYKSFSIAVSQGSFKQPVLMTIPWPSRPELTQK